MSRLSAPDGFVRYCSPFFRSKQHGITSLLGQSVGSQGKLLAVVLIDFTFLIQTGHYRLNMLFTFLLFIPTMKTGGCEGLMNNATNFPILQFYQIVFIVCYFIFEEGCKCAC